MAVSVLALSLAFAHLAMALPQADDPAAPAVEAPAPAEAILDAAPSAEVLAAETAPAAMPGLVFDGVSDDAVVGKVVDYLNALGTMQGGFEQIAPSGAQSTGKFWLRRPGQIRFDYDPPSPLKIVATQGNVYVSDSDLDQTDFYPIKKTPLRFLLAKEVDLDGVEVTRVDRGTDAVIVTFAATDDETEGDLSVVFAAPELALREWIVRDPQNGATIVTLRDVEAGPKLPNSLFRAPEAGGAFINN